MPGQRNSFLRRKPSALEVAVVGKPSYLWKIKRLVIHTLWLSNGVVGPCGGMDGRISIKCEICVRRLHLPKVSLFFKIVYLKIVANLGYSPSYNLS